MLVQEHELSKVLVSNEVVDAKDHLKSDHQLNAFELGADLFPDHGLSSNILEAVFEAGIQPSWGDDLVLGWLHVLEDAL